MKISDGFILDTVGGEYVAVSLDYSKEHFSGMIKLTGVSAYLWQLLKEERTERELVTAVIEKYNINEETATRDIRGFLQQLSKNGILHNDKRGDDYLESLALYRKLCEKMLEYDIFLLHCSAVALWYSLEW